MRREIRAAYMRGGTSKGLFFDPADLPADPKLRDAILLRAIGSPDPYGLQMDGMGGGSSSTSKASLVRASRKPDHDLDYFSAALPINGSFVDWTGNCGNLAAAVGPFALRRRMIEISANGVVPIRIWQVNTRRTIIAHVPVFGGQAIESGDFLLDGIAFPAAEIQLDFDAGTNAPPLFPCGAPITTVEIPGGKSFAATLIDAGSPTILVHANAFGLIGTESPAELNADPGILSKAEAMRCHAAVRMGMAATVEEVSARLHQSPKIAFVSAPQAYATSSGRSVRTKDVDVVARTFSMGKLHHAMTGTGTVALAAAAAVPGTVVSLITGPRKIIRIGHASGTVTAGSKAVESDGWRIERTSLSRSARMLMDGLVFVDM